MKKVIVTLAVLARFATPAFAQSFCDCNGSGNVLPFGDKAAASQIGKIAVRRAGMGSFAMVPTVLQPRAAAVSATMKCSVTTERHAENRAHSDSSPCFHSFVCLGR